MNDEDECEKSSAEKYKIGKFYMMHVNNEENNSQLYLLSDLDCTYINIYFTNPHEDIKVSVSKNIYIFKNTFVVTFITNYRNVLYCINTVRI